MQSLIVDFSYAADGGYLKGTFQYGVELARMLSEQTLPFRLRCVVSGEANLAHLRKRLAGYPIEICSIQLPQSLWKRYLLRQVYFIGNTGRDDLVISIGSCGVFSSAFNIIVIHDLYWIDIPRVYRFGQYLYYQLVVAANLRCANLLIVTTSSTKNRVDRLRGNRRESSYVVYYLPSPSSAAPAVLPALSESNDDAVTRFDYSILTVAAHTINKNLPGVLAAFQNLLQQDSRWQLTIVTDAAAEVQEMARNIKGRIHVLTRISDEELLMLYRQSLYYWQLSFVEGFGLPLIEALKENCRIICSDLPVFHEILGGAACYVDPRDPESVAQLCRRWPQPRQSFTSVDVLRRLASSNRAELRRLSARLRCLQRATC